MTGLKDPKFLMFVNVIVLLSVFELMLTMMLGGIMVHSEQDDPAIFISFGTVIFILPCGIFSGKVNINVK